MANLTRDWVFDFTDIRRTQATATSVIGTPASYVDVTSLRARLNSISASTYPASTLDKMTLNDMIYAVRLNDDLAGVK